MSSLYGSGLYGAGLYGLGVTTAAVTVHVEAAFGSNPTDASYTWTDISSYVRSLSYGRGRQNELNRAETGTAQLLIADPGSDFDPSNPTGAFSANVRPMVPIRAYAHINTADYPMMLHYADRWPRTLRLKNTYTERTLSTRDGFAWLAQSGLGGQTFPVQQSGARYAGVLNAIGWPAALRDIDTGNTEIEAATFAADDQTKALDHLLTVNDSENGFTYVNAAGQVTLIDRHSLLKAPFGTSQATFCDAGGSAGTNYVDIVPSFDLDLVANEWIGTREGGLPQTASDSTSQTKYAKRSQTFTSLTTSDVEVKAQAQWKLRQFKDPLNRIESMTVMPVNDLVAWTTLFALEPGKRITILEHPPGFAAEQSKDYIIERLDVAFVPGPTSQTTFTYQLWPADSTAWIILDQLGNDALNVNVLAY